jgi:NADH-quinone oxidoreductase subunit J
MGAEFVAAVQIIVYGGAIMVLFVFVIMLLNAGIEEHTNFSKLAGFPGLLLAFALTGFIAATIARSTDTVQAASQPGNIASTRDLSNMIFQDFVYPFELTSFLILVAVLGAIVLAQRETRP